MKTQSQKVVSFPTTKVRALVRGLCPRCRSGKIFGGFIDMNQTCPSCGLLFEREPGYFCGSLLLSHLAGMPLMVLLVGVAMLYFGPDTSLVVSTLTAIVAFAALSPILCRYGRILWIHLDQGLDPARRPPRTVRRVRTSAVDTTERAAV